jgi:UDP-N-acetylmuramoyl-tripeptide--D-alanyl-D-alanine ligase
MAEPLWTSDEILAATGGRLDGAPFAAAGVSIDTRTLEQGDLFVALAGERDGHEFAAAALERGAAGVLATRSVGGPTVLVGDTLKALERLGEAARVRATHARRGAVTGSVGKTSVTQAIRAGLLRAGRAHASVKSYNNHIGVPLTLARMPRDTERAVFEIGMNHADEITPLVRMVQPHAVAITTVAQAHIENFADGEAGVARAKAEIFDGLIPGGAAVLNADDRWFDLLQGAADRAGAQVVTFGSAPGCDAQLTGFTPFDGGAEVAAVLHGKAVRFPIRQTGAHWGLNSLAVLLMLEALGVGLDLGVEALGAFEPLSGRGAERAIAAAGGRFVLIDESYNANPVSVDAALALLGQTPVGPHGRRIAVLGDMLELGSKGKALHRGLAAPITANAIDLVFCCGPLMQSLWQALPAGQRGGYAEDSTALEVQILPAIRGGDVIMVKGSLDSRMAPIVKALQRVYPRHGTLEEASAQG